MSKVSNKDMLAEAAKLAERQLENFSAVRLLVNDVAYMPVPRCETCAHWKDDRSDQTGACDADTFGPYAAKMWTDCGENTIRTAEDFGCVLWKEKA